LKTANGPPPNVTLAGEAARTAAASASTCAQRHLFPTKTRPSRGIFDHKENTREGDGSANAVGDHTSHPPPRTTTEYKKSNKKTTQIGLTKRKKKKKK
jgi:hypothetical protein